MHFCLKEKNVCDGKQNKWIGMYRFKRKKTFYEDNATRKQKRKKILTENVNVYW